MFRLKATRTTLFISYTPVQNKKFKVWRKRKAPPDRRVGAQRTVLSASLCAGFVDPSTAETRAGPSQDQHLL